MLRQILGTDNDIHMYPVFAMIPLKLGIGINMYSPDIYFWDRINISVQTQSIIDGPHCTFKVVRVTGGPVGFEVSRNEG